MAKKTEVKRTRMTDKEIDQYLKHYAKSRDLKGKEFEEAVHRCAATRWAALERNAKASKRPKKAPAKVAKKAPAKAAKKAPAKAKKAA